MGAGGAESRQFSLKPLIVSFDPVAARAIAPVRCLSGIPLVGDPDPKGIVPRGGISDPLLRAAPSGQREEEQTSAEDCQEPQEDLRRSDSHGDRARCKWEAERIPARKAAELSK